MPEADALPLYVQISEMLIREVAAGRLLPGERLPPEREMAAGHGISVGTLRKALADLAAKGLLDRVQGSGNYIRDADTGASVYAFFRLELPEGGGLPMARLLSVARREKPAGLPTIGTSPDAHRIRRLRLLNDLPVAVEEIWLDGAAAETIAAEDLSDSLYLTYRTALGLRITRAEDRVAQGHVPGWAPAAFAPPVGAPVPRVARTSWADDGRPVEVSHTWVDPDRAHYVQRMR